MRIVLVEVSVQAPDSFTGSDDHLLAFIQNEVSTAVAGQLTTAGGDTLRVLAVEAVEVANG